VVENDLSAHCGHTDRIPITGDPGDNTFDQISVASNVEGTETERVHQSDRARSHRENVPDDPAHTGGRALMWLDRRGVIVALDPQRYGEAFTDVDDARAFTRPDQYPGSLGGKSPQILPR
jgi:hypothetical protein